MLLELFVFGVRLGIICVNKFCSFGLIFKCFLICFWLIIVIEVGILLMFLNIWLFDIIMCFIFFVVSFLLMVLLVKDWLFSVRVIRVSEVFNMFVFVKLVFII